MTPELQKKLESCDTLPTPSGVATQIVNVANDPDADPGKVAAVLGLDPAVAVKVLRLANSPIYAQRREIRNLRQAVVVLGLDATISLALSFSLLKSLHPRGRTTGLDYELFWRRSLLAAPIGRILGARMGLPNQEALFLSCLVQDVGILALDQTIDVLYEDIGINQSAHHVLEERERERLGTDHADVGGWLLKKWGLPDLIIEAVTASHDLNATASSPDNRRFVRCVALSSMIAETFLCQDGADRFVALAEAADEHLGLDPDGLAGLLEEVGAAISHVEAIFETQILAQADTDSVLEKAREALTNRTLGFLQTLAGLRQETQTLETRTRELEESSRRDGLTGLYNRAYLDEFLDKAFDTAGHGSGPLSIAFVDLDKFKNVNDTYGHQIGDQVLSTTARALQDAVRASDIAARYGGEEFLLVFPNTSLDQVQMICERIVRTFQETGHEIEAGGEKLTVTVSIGIATHAGECWFGTVEEFIGAADQALYRAKLEGRNTTRVSESLA